MNNFTAFALVHPKNFFWSSSLWHTPWCPINHGKQDTPPEQVITEIKKSEYKESDVLKHYKCLCQWIEDNHITTAEKEAANNNVFSEVIEDIPSASAEFWQRKMKAEQKLQISHKEHFKILKKTELDCEDFTLI